MDKIKNLFPGQLTYAIGFAAIAGGLLLMFWDDTEKRNLVLAFIREHWQALQAIVFGGGLVALRRGLKRYQSEVVALAAPLGKSTPP